MARLRNVTREPHEIDTEAGRFSVPAGAVLDQALSEEHLAAALKTRAFAVEDADEPEAPLALEAMSVPQLRALLKERGVTADRRWGRDRLLGLAQNTASAE